MDLLFNSKIVILVILRILRDKQAIMNLKKNHLIFPGGK